MKKYTATLLLTASLGLASATFADDEKEKKDRPAPGGDAVEKERGPRDGERQEGRRDGDRPEGRREDDRREGDRPPPPRDGERREGDRPAPPRDGDRPPPREGDGPQRPGAGAGGMAEMIKAADTDGDKKISHEEWKAAAVKRAEEAFKRMDGDGDGFLTQQDLEKLRERFSGGRPGGDRPATDRPGGDRPREGADERAGGPRRPARPESE